MQLKNVVWLAALTFAPSAFAYNPECRTIGGMRVETAAQVAMLQDVCEVRGPLGIFLDGVQQVTLPRLEKIETLNIESFGLQAISFPALKSARYLYISGGQLTVAEFPALRSVGSIMHIKSPRLKHLNFPSLGSVWKLAIQGNLSLEFIFAENLYDIHDLQLVNNPLLNAASAALLQGNTRVISDDEKEQVAKAKEEAEHLRRLIMERRINEPPMRPTGHQGWGWYGQYYSWYPYHYYNYWNNISAWGYDRYVPLF